MDNPPADPNNTTQIPTSGVTLGGKPVLEAPEGVFGVNEFVMHTGGSRPGYGRFLMTRADYDYIVSPAVIHPQKLVMSCEVGGGVTIKTVVCGAETVLPSMDNTSETNLDVVAVVVRDLRATDYTQPMYKAFNVQYPDYRDTGTPNDYIASTVGTLALRTWSDVTSGLGLPALQDDQGTDLFPSWDPRNLIFDNVPVGRAADHLAGHLYLVVGYDHANRNLTWYNPGQISQANGALLQKANTGVNVKTGPQQSTLLAGALSVRSNARLPGKINVNFPGPSFGQADAFLTAYTATVTPGGGDISTWASINMPEYVRTPDPAGNTSTLDTVASDLASRYFAFISQTPGEWRYAGIWPFQPDGQIRAIKWSCGRAGVTTTIRSNNDLDFSPVNDMRRSLDAVGNQLAIGMGGTAVCSANSGNGSRRIMTPPPTVYVRIGFDPTDTSGYYANSQLYYVIAGSFDRNCVAVNLREAELPGTKHLLRPGTYPGWLIGNQAPDPLPIVYISEPLILQVSLTPVGGGPGGAGAPPTYTYDATDVNGNRVLANATPTWRRPMGPVSGPATQGMLSWDAGSLLFTDEQYADQNP